jgi:GTPase SAR1 family protein
MMAAQLQEFKVLFLGAANTGKSHLRLSLSRCEIPANYRPTLGADVSPVRLFGNGNICRANIWDCAGDNRYAGLEGGYYNQAHAVVIFKEEGSTSHIKYENLLNNIGLTNIPRLYIDNYKNQNQTIDEWKQQLYDLLHN